MIPFASSTTKARAGTRIFVVKVASRCNLACTYCYMYFHADQSWRLQPKFMSRTTIELLASRIDEHVESTGANSVMVVAHGGEPLLFPDLEYFFTTMRTSISRCEVRLSIQTNGTLLNATNIALLNRHSVHVGISIDGSSARHDSARSGTYNSVIQGLHLAQGTIPHLVESVLQVIDPSIPPREMLDLLDSYGVRRGDLLFPDLNYDTFDESGIGEGAIGRWLVQVFDEWVGRSRTVYLRLFMTIIHLLTGGRFGTDQLGANSIGSLIIETDGSYDIYDGLKTTFEGAGLTGMNVRAHPISATESHRLVQAFRDKASSAAAGCLKCRLFPVCGGGSPVHRYREQTGFMQASVYCNDLTMIIEHIRGYLRSVRPQLALTV